MKSIKKNINWIIAITLIMALLVGVFWFAYSSLMPPDKEKTEEYLQGDKDDLIIVVDFLNNLDYSFVHIDESNIENGTMFTGAYTREQKIENKTVLKALKKILNSKNYEKIVKNDNTVYFQKWSFLQQERGIAFNTNEEESLSVEYLIKSGTLSEPGWYFYEADYEEYRNQKG